MSDKGTHFKESVAVHTQIMRFKVESVKFYFYRQGQIYNNQIGDATTSNNGGDLQEVVFIDPILFGVDYLCSLSNVLFVGCNILNINYIMQSK